MLYVYRQYRLGPLAYFVEKNLSLQWECRKAMVIGGGGDARTFEHAFLAKPR